MNWLDLWYTFIFGHIFEEKQNTANLSEFEIPVWTTWSASFFSFDLPDSTVAVTVDFLSFLGLNIRCWHSNQLVQILDSWRSMWWVLQWHRGHHQQVYWLGWADPPEIEMIHIISLNLVVYFHGRRKSWILGWFSNVFRTHAATNGYLELTQLKGCQRFNTILTSNLEVCKFWWIFT